MREAIRRPLTIISCGALALVGGVAYAASGHDGGATGAPATVESTAETGTAYVYRSAIQRDTITVRDARGAFAPYSVATERRLQTWTAPDGSTLTRQNCLVARNAAPRNGDEDDPSNGQACQTMEFRMSRADLNPEGLLDSDASDLAERIETAAGADASPAQRASVAASVALNPAATAEQRKAAEEFIVRLAGEAGAPGDDTKSVRVSGADGSVELEYNPVTGDVAAYRESIADGGAGRAVSDRTVTQIATVGNEGEVPAP